MAATTESGARYMAQEDYIGPMTRTEPADTPLFTLLANETELGATSFDWPVDAWNAPKGAQGWSDNTPVDTTTAATNELTNNASNRRKMGNAGQAFKRPFGVGWIQQAVPKTPGVTNELSKAAADELVVMKQEFECAVSSGDQFAVDDDGTNGSITAGLGALTSRTNTYTGTTMTTGKVPYTVGGVDFRPPAGAMEGDTVGDGTYTEGAALGSLNLAMLKTVVKELRNVVKRNQDYLLLAGTDLREAITALTDPAVTNTGTATVQMRTFTQQIKDAELGASIDVVRTDFGRLLIAVSDWIGTTCEDVNGAYTATRRDRVFTVKPKWGYILTRRVLAKRWGVHPEKFKLNADGAGDWAGYRSYCGLKVAHPQLHGRLFMSA